jgi:hypothetical protein
MKTLLPVSLTMLFAGLALAGCTTTAPENPERDKQIAQTAEVVAPTPEQTQTQTQTQAPPADTADETIVPPANFVVQIDNDSIERKVALLTAREPDKEIRFDWGIETLNDSALASLSNWIDDTRPDMVAIAGTSGADRYRELAERRQLEVARILKQSGIAAVLVPFDPDQPGRRTMIWSLDKGEIALAKVSLLPIMVIP